MGGIRGPYMRYIYHPSVFFYERCLTDGKFLPPPPPTKRKERQKKKKKKGKKAILDPIHMTSCLSSYHIPSIN
jgi:hypothetical protein